MQFLKLAFLAAIASVTAQTVSINDLPSCALEPAVAAISTTGCNTNITCVCEDSGFLEALTPKIKAACDTADFNTAVQIAVELCAENGVTITPPTQSSTYAPAVSATSAPVATSAIATTSAPKTTSTVPKNGTISTSALPSVVTANVAAAHGTWAAAGLLGVGALLAAF